MKIDQVYHQMVRDSSAGVRGWASVAIGDWHEQATPIHDPRGLAREDRPPLTMKGQEELNDQDGTSQPPVPKPQCAPQDSAEVRQRVISVQKLVGGRLPILKLRSIDIKRGDRAVGLVKISQGRKFARGIAEEQWHADMAGRVEYRVLEASAMCFGPEDKFLCAATSWQRLENSRVYSRLWFFRVSMFSIHGSAMAD